MKSVLISIQPKWCELIASGKKTIEVRKTKPKIDTPFKCYIYQTKESKRRFLDHRFNSAINGTSHHTEMGKVIGEFVCDEINRGVLSISEYVDSVNIGSDKTCLSVDEIKAYLGMRYFETKGRHGFYGWNISNLIIYDKPKKLSEFRSYNVKTYLENGYPMPTHEITRPPQSWCYVEELTAY
jgi:predicted transcriptional regulator